MGGPSLCSGMASQTCRYRTNESTSFPESLSTFTGYSSERLSFYLNNDQDRIDDSEQAADHLLANNIQSLQLDERYKSQYPSLFDNPDRQTWQKKLLIILPHFGLVFLSLIYTVIGAIIFYYIEYPNESTLKRKNLERINQLHSAITDDLWELTRNETIQNKADWDRVTNQYFDQLMQALHDAFSENHISVEEIRNNHTESVWSFSSSFFFSITLITTIGYGHLIPKTLDGRLACLIFSLFGIPLILVTIADLGKFLSLVTGKLYIALSDLCKLFVRKVSLCCLQLSKRSNEHGSEETASAGTSDAYRPNLSEMDFMDPDEKSVSVIFVLVIWIGYTALGFGDIVPQNKTFLWATVIYFVLGLVVTTMCVDLVGSQYIQKFHFIGRNVRRVTETAMANWNGRAIRLGDVFHYVAFLQKSFGLGPDQMDRIAALPTEYLIECMMHGRQPNLKLFTGRPFIPNDIYYIKWIEQPRTASYTSEKVLASVESLEVTSRCSNKRTPREWYYHMAFEHMSNAEQST
ncbi:TWiK family of potassium channels protein 7 [Trichinella sp. T6]|nr:TWiK family of potassium channels protein 7 [Trichinella sp. T9]KRX74014.1 TWiK family of potassium channels protein 7 [Trichinella sp. T6]